MSSSTSLRDFDRERFSRFLFFLCLTGSSSTSSTSSAMKPCISSLAFSSSSESSSSSELIVLCFFFFMDLESVSISSSSSVVPTSASSSKNDAMISQFFLKFDQNNLFPSLERQSLAGRLTYIKMASRFVGFFHRFFIKRGLSKSDLFGVNPH